MGLVHTPRTLVSIAKGWIQRQRAKPTQGLIGFGSDNAYPYQSRVGLFDVDYIGHMNNAAYLSHAEYARWEMMTCNGLLPIFFKNGIHYIVSSTTIRYRQELRPLFRKFLVESYLAAIDDRNVWILHDFLSQDDGRLKTQVVVQGVFVQASGPKKGVADPSTILKDIAGLEESVVNDLLLPYNIDDTYLSEEKVILNGMFDKYTALEKSIREVATKVDERHQTKQS